MISTNRTYRNLMGIALILILGGSLLGSWINTGAGLATVSDVKVFAPNGYVISAYLYTPKSATPESPGQLFSPYMA
jgi:hypothetical protein